MIPKRVLYNLYTVKGLSMEEVAVRLGCSANKVKYWLVQHDIMRRSISDAVYLKNNPNGDPFSFRKPKTIEDGILYGMGIGLYWGEGTKSNLNSVRLGNTDSELLNTFILFLERIFQIKKTDMRFGLQLFTDIDEKKALDYLVGKLKVRKNQFYKVTVTMSGSIGTYRKKSEYGVVTVYYNNTKLRNKLVELLPQ